MGKVHFPSHQPQLFRLPFVLCQDCVCNIWSFVCPQEQKESNNTRNRALMSRVEKGLLGGVTDCKQLLHDAQRQTTTQGSSTITVVTVQSNLWCSANVGDSSFVVWRGAEKL